MQKKLNKLTKKELIEIISKFKKESLISFILNKKIILNKKGGENNENKQTHNATRKNILFDEIKSLEAKNSKNNKNTMANNSLYNNIYEDEEEDHI